MNLMSSFMEGVMEGSGSISGLQYVNLSLWREWRESDPIPGLHYVNLS
jgi:hypothetical protein